MANHHLTIAKAAFAAACFRPDVTTLSREEISNFLSLLESAISKCSPSNVQNCKIWIVDNIASSSPRSAALTKYLVSYSKHAKSDEARNHSEGSITSLARKKLHIMYILSDVLHHVKYHSSNLACETHLREGLKPQLAELVRSTKSQQAKRAGRRLDNLLDIWEEEQYFDNEYFTHLRSEVPDQTQETSRERASTLVPAKEVPYIMPTTHGDPSTPYYDLPAANLMPHIVPHKSIPMRPDQIRALQLSSGPADESLINAVRDFLKDVDRMNEPYQTLDDEGIVADTDELGQLSWRNEVDELVGYTYYGWSRAFCDRMKKRGQESDDNDSRRRSRSYTSSRTSSRSRSYSRSSPKRRRYDRSESHSPARNRPNHRSRSGSTSPERNTAAFQHAHLSTTSTLYNIPATNLQSLPHSLVTTSTGEPSIPPSRSQNYAGQWPPPPPPPPSQLPTVKSMPHQTPSHLYPGSDASFTFNGHSNER